MRNPNIDNLEIIAEGLGKLNEEVVFVGGATAGFYVTNPGAPEPRPTMDVDCIIELTSYAKLAELLPLRTSSRARSKLTNLEGRMICGQVLTSRI